MEANLRLQIDERCVGGVWQQQSGQGHRAIYKG